MNQYEFNRYWAQVVMQPSGPAGKTIPALRSHGREVEFGRHLTEDQRCALTQAFRQQLRNGR